MTYVIDMSASCSASPLSRVMERVDRGSVDITDLEEYLKEEEVMGVSYSIGSQSSTARHM